MPYAYEGLATVTVLALYLGQPPQDLTALELNVRVHSAGSGRFRIEFDVTCTLQRRRTPCG